jgi:hypothetical protein
MAWARSHLLIAVDAAAVTGAVVSWRPSGPRVGALARVGLETGAVAPSLVEPNIAGREEVTAVVAALRRDLRTNGRPAILVLPDGVSRTLLLEVPRRTTAREFARFRLSKDLSFGPDEAIVDTLPVGGALHLCAAVRRSVVSEYETAVGDAGLTIDRVHLGPLAALAGLLRTVAGESGIGVVMGDAAVSFAAFRDGRLSVFRTRRRDFGADEGERLRDETLRTAARSGIGDGVPVLVLGCGATAVVDRLRDLGLPARAGWGFERRGLPLEAVEVGWLGAVLA